MQLQHIVSEWRLSPSDSALTQIDFCGSLLSTDDDQCTSDQFTSDILEVVKPGCDELGRIKMVAKMTPSRLMFMSGANVFIRALP